MNNATNIDNIFQPLSELSDATASRQIQDFIKLYIKSNEDDRRYIGKLLNLYINSTEETITEIRNNLGHVLIADLSEDDRRQYIKGVIDSFIPGIS